MKILICILSLCLLSTLCPLSALSKILTKSHIREDSVNDLSQDVFRSDSATYCGYLKGYSPKLGFSTGKVIVNNIITGLQESFLIEIHSDGTFFAKFPMNYPQEVFVRMKGAASNVYCEPGKKIFQVFNLSDKTENPLIMGDLASINNELSAARHLDEIKYPVNYSRNFTPDQYKEYFQSLKAYRLNTLDKFRDSINLSERAYRLLKATITFRTGVKLFDYNQYRERHGLAPVQLEATYYLSFLREININDARNCESTYYRFFINRLKHVDIAGVKNTKAMSASLLFEELKKYITFTQQELETIAGFSDGDNIFDKENILKDKRGNILVHRKAFIEKYEQPMIAAAWEHVQKQRYQKLKQILNIPDGLALDIMKAQDILQNLESFYLPYSEKKLEQIKTYITTPYLYAYIIKANDQTYKKIEDNRLIKQGGIVHHITKNPADSLFETIMRRFKSKVVYIDFWATWCAPCLEDIKRIGPLKEELVNEDIAFVYITNQSSPLETFNNRIPAIKGEHFRMSTDEWNILSAKFKIGGIPHYALVDKDGKVVDPNLRETDPGRLKAKLLELINQ